MADALGTIQNFGTQFRMLTMRGWVILDTWDEVRDEENEINSLLNK